MNRPTSGLIFAALLSIHAVAGAADKVEQALTRTEQTLVDSLVRGDDGPFKATLADNFVFVAPDGSLQDRAGFVADLTNGNLKMAASTNADMHVRQYGNTAIVTYASTDKGMYKTTDISGHYRWTDVFVKQNGKWRIVATQGTRIAPPPKP